MIEARVRDEDHDCDTTWTYQAAPQHAGLLGSRFGNRRGVLGDLRVASTGGKCTTEVGTFRGKATKVRLAADPDEIR